MPRNTSPIEVDERGNERHPAFGRIRANRVSNMPGSVLFDSDIRHQHSIIIEVSTASRKRDLSRDWIHDEKQVLAIELSEAQWGAFVSSIGSSGVPCTINAREGTLIDSLPYQPRMAASMAEVSEAADEVFGKIQAALTAYEEHKTAANLRNLRAAVRSAEPNLTYVAKSLAEHTEGVVQRAKADIEAMVVNKAQQIGAPDDVLVKELLQISS